jgi:hypothetical protein
MDNIPSVIVAAIMRDRLFRGTDFYEDTFRKI